VVARRTRRRKRTAGAPPSLVRRLCWPPAWLPSSPAGDCPGRLAGRGGRSGGRAHHPRTNDDQVPRTGRMSPPGGDDSSTHGANLVPELLRQAARRDGMPGCWTRA
jgi:hypothetical protein